MTGFTELVAAALAGAHRQAALQDMADRDAALRRVAELVARGAAPGAVFDAVAVEASRLLDGVPTILLRFEDDDTYTPVATCRHPLPIGERYPVETGGTAERIRRTGGTARMDTYADRPDLRVSYAIGLRSSAAAPIVVDGRVWGMLSAVSFDGPLPPSSEPDLARFTELVALAIANAESRTALVASRARVVATGDEARRRLQRDVHDGAQQRLVQAVITLKLARAAAGGDGRVAPLIDEALRHAEQATAELRDLVRGILPASLSRGGLRAGVGTLVSGLPLPVDVDVDPVRLAPELETTAYFVIAEALTNVVKHARAGSARVGVHVRDGAVQIEVRDDGIGGAVAGRGTGLTGLSDRVAAAEGEVEISSPAGEGTRVSASLPVRP
jgi:signal transduction histidine kinase